MFFLCTCGVFFSHSRQWPHVAHFERGRIPSQRMFFTESGRLTPMCKKQNMRKIKSKTINTVKSKWECGSFRHIYKPKICGSSVILATMGDFSDNIFLRAAFGGAIEIPATSSSSNPSASTCTSASGAATFSDAPQSSTSKGKGRAKLQPRRRNATHHKYSKLEDHLILKAVELKGRDWRTVLAFLKTNWEVLGEEGKIYRDCNIGEKSLQERLRKRAWALLNKVKDK